VPQPQPLHLARAQAEDVAHDVDLEAVEVLVDARPEEGLELVRARLNLLAVSSAVGFFLVLDRIGSIAVLSLWLLLAGGVL
jgi:hypothetical protein